MSRSRYDINQAHQAELNSGGAVSAVEHLRSKHALLRPEAAANPRVRLPKAPQAQAEAASQRGPREDLNGLTKAVTGDYFQLIISSQPTGGGYRYPFTPDQSRSSASLLHPAEDRPELIESAHESDAGTTVAYLVQH